jgi:hypothetical protein
MIKNQRDHSNKMVMALITAFILFPIIVSLYAYFPVSRPVEPSEQPFDSTLVAGYSYFKSMGIDINNASNTKLYNSIYPLLGAPHRGKSSGRGFDCSGLVRIVYRDVFDFQVKGSSLDIHRNSIPIDLQDIKEADLVFFKISSSQINHVGIYLGNGKFIHVTTQAGVSLNDLSERYYQQHYFSAGRLER